MAHPSLQPWTTGSSVPGASTQHIKNSARSSVRGYARSRVRRHRLAEHRQDAELTSVAISPDLGERYLDSVCQSNWVSDICGPHALELGPVSSL
jgi:hypothetical protein